MRSSGKTGGRRSKDVQKRYQLISILWAVILLVLGIFLLVRPGAAVTVICTLIGVAILVLGLFLLGSWFSERKQYGASNPYSLTGAIILIVLGLIFSIRPQIMVGFIGIILSIILLTYGINDFIEMQNLRLFGDSRWYISLITGIVTVVLGILVLFNPFSTQKILARVAGVALIVSAVSGIFVHARAHSFINKVAAAADEVKDAFQDAASGRSHYDENGQEIIDVDAKEEDVSDQQKK